MANDVQQWVHISVRASVMIACGHVFVIISRKLGGRNRSFMLCILPISSSLKDFTFCVVASNNLVGR